MSDAANLARDVSRILAVPLVERGYRPRPNTLFLELNRRCNHRCIMCDIWKNPTEGLPIPEIERIFAARFFDTLESVVLAGGEPTLRKDLKQVLAFFVERLPRLRFIAILTNGYSTERIIELSNHVLDLLDERSDLRRVFGVQISLDGIGEHYNIIRGVKKAWSNTHSTVLELAKLSKTRKNFQLWMHAVMQPQNLEQLETIDEFGRDLGVPVLFSPVVISDTYLGNRALESKLAFNAQQKEKVRQFILRREPPTPGLSFYYQDVAKMIDGAARSRTCMMGYYQMYVNMEGKVFPCINSGDHVIGDLTLSAPEQIWFGRDADAARRAVRSDFCPTCPSACDGANLRGAGELATVVKDGLVRSLRRVFRSPARDTRLADPQAR